MQLFTTGDRYEGEWYKDVRQGRGTFYYHGNDVYQVSLQNYSLLFDLTNAGRMAR